MNSTAVLFFFLSLAPFHLLTVGVEGGGCTWSQSDTHDTRYDSSGRGIGPSQRSLTTHQQMQINNM